MAIVGRTPTIAEASTGTTLSGTLPSDRQAGDVVVVVFGFSDSVANFTGPGGSWVTLVAPFTHTGINRLLAAYYQFDPGAAPGATQVTSGRMTVICQAYGGVDSTTPVDVTAATATAAATPVTVGAITTVTDGARLIGGCVADTSTSVITCPATMTQLQEATGTGRRTEMADETFTPAGSTGTRQWTLSTGALSMAAFTAALRPSAGGGGGGPSPVSVPSFRTSQAGQLWRI